MADFLSRHKMEHWEICLKSELFNQVVSEFGISPTLDAFASRSTTRLPCFMSWHKDSLTVAQDAMMNSWDEVTYLFPPVPLLLRVLQKLRREAISAIVVCPHWPSAIWWPLLQELLVQPPVQLPHFRSALLHSVNSPLPYLDPVIAAHIRSPAML